MMLIGEWIDLIKASLRALVTLLFTVCWVITYFKTGVAEWDPFSLVTVGMLTWYFGESFMSGALNRISLKSESDAK